MISPDTKALILAAGYATRLWPLTLNKPKPLLRIGNKPMLEHIIDKVESISGIDKIYIVTNTKYVKNFNQWKKSRRLNSRFEIIDDGMDTLQERRGSIGDIIFSVDKKRLKSDLLVIAGDNIFDSGLKGFIRASRKNRPFATIGLFDISSKALARQYGIVGLNESFKIVSFEEKPKKPKSTLAAMCLYYFPKEKLPMLNRYKAQGMPLDFAGYFIKWLSEKEDVYGYRFKGKWLDIGDKKSLKNAQRINWN